MAAATIDKRIYAAEEEALHVLHRHDGPVRVLDRSVSKTERLAAGTEFAKLLRESGRVIGLDMEWVPDRCKQHDHKVALVQLAVGRVVWLVRTCQISLPEFVRSILLDPSVVKVVVDFDSADRAKLASSFGIRIEGDPAAAGFLDISSMAVDCGATGKGLKRLALRYGHHMKKEKKMSISNWEASTLSEAQKQYAADDAFFSLLVGGDLLGEDCARNAEAVLADPTHAGLRQRARQAWAEAEACVRGARRSEDCSARDAAHEALAEELHGIVSEAARETGSAKVPLDEVLRRARLSPSLSEQASRHGITLGKAFFQEQRGAFTVSADKNGGQPKIAACSAAERMPPTEAELALPWENDPEGSLRLWEAAERGRAGAAEGCYGEEGPSVAQLRKRLARVGQALEARGNHAATKVVTELVQGNLLREQGRGCAPPSGGGGLKKPVSGGGLEKRAATVGTDAGVHAHPADCVVFVGQLPKDWTDTMLQAAASASLDEGVLVGAVVPPGKKRVNRGFGLLIFKEPGSAQGFLESAGASEDGASVVDMGGERVAVTRYVGRN